MENNSTDNAALQQVGVIREASGKGKPWSIAWITLLAVMIAVGVWSLGFLPWLVEQRVITWPQFTSGEVREGDSSTFGDSFGVVNSLVSALALAGVIVAVILQSRELRAQHRELSAQAKEMRTMNTQFEISASAAKETQLSMERQLHMQLQHALIDAINSMAAAAQVDKRLGTLRSQQKLAFLDKLREFVVAEILRGPHDSSNLSSRLQDAFEEWFELNDSLKTIFGYMKALRSCVEKTDRNWDGSGGKQLVKNYSEIVSRIIADLKNLSQDFPAAKYVDQIDDRLASAISKLSEVAANDKLGGDRAMNQLNLAIEDLGIASNLVGNRISEISIDGKW